MSGLSALRLRPRSWCLFLTRTTHAMGCVCLLAAASVGIRICNSSSALTTFLPCLSQGAITMAVFGSGMRKEYAFFGYEGDFVRSRDGPGSGVFSPPLIGFTGLLWVRHSRTGGALQHMATSTNASLTPRLISGPGLLPWPHVPPCCVFCLFRASPPTPPLQAEAASLCFRTAITFGVLSALSAVTFIAAAVREKGLAVSTPAVGVGEATPSSRGGGRAAGYRPV